MRTTVTCGLTCGLAQLWLNLHWALKAFSGNMWVIPFSQIFLFLAASVKFTALSRNNLVSFMESQNNFSKITSFKLLLLSLDNEKVFSFDVIQLKQTKKITKIMLIYCVTYVLIYLLYGRVFKTVYKIFRVVCLFKRQWVTVLQQIALSFVFYCVTNCVLWYVLKLRKCIVYSALLLNNNKKLDSLPSSPNSAVARANEVREYVTIVRGLLK